MDYPPYHLSNRTRSLIFAVFTALFLIIAPTVAMYTAGYRLAFHPLMLQRIGVLSVDIQPNDAEVYLNNTRILQPAPMRISNLVPGTYHLRIEKSGYLPWVKDIVIEKSKTTYIKDITLFAIHTPEAVETNDTLTNIFPSSDGNYIVEKFEKDGQAKLVLFDTVQELATPLLTLNTENISDIEWSDRSDTVAIFEHSPSSTTVTVFGANDPTHRSLVQRSDLIKSYQWKESFYKDTLLVRFSKSLSLLDGKNPVVEEPMTNTSTLFFRESSGDDWYFDATTSSLKNKKDTLYLGNAEPKSIIDINENRALVQTNSGLLIVGRDEKKEIKNIATQNFFYDTNRKEYIAWSPYELWTIYNNGTVALLNRTSNPILQVAALDKTGELLVVTDNKLLGFNPGYYITEEVLNEVQVEKATVEKNTRTIYFYGTWQGKKGLYKLKY